MSGDKPQATQDDGGGWPPFSPRLEAIMRRDRRRLIDPPRSFREWARAWIKGLGPYRPHKRYRT